MTVIVAPTPWARRYLTDEVRERIRAIVPAEVTRVVISAGRKPGDWIADVVGAGRSGIARRCTSIEVAVSLAVRDRELGPALTWCSTCPEPAVLQIAGEAYCATCPRGDAR